jgi:N-sulfoglucosamine sulfohydrolase
MRIRLLCLLLATVAGVRIGEARPAGRLPNLLLITADDMNADSSGWMGSKLGATPNLDAFAATGFRFEQCHASAPICQPSRAALMTGRVPHRNGALGFGPVRPDVPTLVEVLKARGYFVAAINKVEHMTPREKFPWDLAPGPGRDTHALRADFEACLRAARAARKPFFINANIVDTHRPFPGEAADAWAAELGTQMAIGHGQYHARPGHTYRPEEVDVPTFLEDLPPVREEVARYYSGVAKLDVSFGAIMKALGASGLADDTLVVFLSDHGMSFPFSKATTYRNGTWSPVIFRGPGLAKRGADRTDLVSSVDIMPTVLELLGVAPPAGMDGRSLVPLTRGEPQPGRDHVVTHVNSVSRGKSFPQRCVRTKDRALMFHPWSDGKAAFKVEAMSGLSYAAMAEAARSDGRIRARLAQYITGTPLAFYDLENDPDERTNLIADPRRGPEVERLQKLLIAHMEKTQDPQLADFRKAIAAREKARPR